MDENILLSSSSSNVLSMSSKMQEINQQALNKARAFIARKFKDPIDLDDINVTHFQLQKQHKAAELQLNGALQTKLDALKRSVDLMDESSSRLDELTSHMKKVDEKINNANTLICKYDKLKRVHNARENLNKVIHQTEFFARVPEKVDELREILDTEPEKLKDVYLEAVKLDALRVGMMKELKRHEALSTNTISKSDKKKKAQSNDDKEIDDLDNLVIGDDDDNDENNGDINDEKERDANEEEDVEDETPIVPEIPLNRRGSMDYSAETNNRVKKIVEAQLRSIPQLMRDIRGRLFLNMERMWFAGYEGNAGNYGPADLVTAFEIIRMHQEYLNRTASQRMKILDEYGFKEEVFNIGPESLKKMRMIIEQKIEGIFENPQFQKQAEKGQKVSEIGIVLDAANQVLQTLTDFKQLVLPCVPPEYGFMKMYVSVMEDQLLFRISALTSNTDQLDVGEILRFVDWVDFYSMQMDTYEEDLAIPLKSNAVIDKDIKLLVIDKGEYHLLPAIVLNKNEGKGNILVKIGEKELELERKCLAMPSSRDLCITFASISDDMLTDYLQRMKQQIMGWFGNIKKQKIEVLNATDNTLMTSTPEDMFNIIQMQLQVATEQLPKKYLKDVMNACLSVLREFQRMAYDQLAFAEEMLYKPKVEVDNEKEQKKGSKNNKPAVPDEFAAYNSQLTDPETLCAIINDTQRMQEKSSELSALLDHIPKLIDGKSFEMDIEVLTASLEELEHGYIDLAVQQVRFLSRAVCEDLEEEVFLKIYEPEWEAGGKFVEIIVATLHDYLPDLQEWLQEYFYNKLLRELLVILIGKYIMALRKKPDSFKFKNHLTAGKRISADKETLIKFFDGYASNISRGGKTDVIKEEFESLTCLFKIVVMLDLPDNDPNIKKLYEKWGADGRALVIAAINANPQTVNEKKSNMIEKAQKMFEKGNYNDDLSVMYKTELEETRIKAAREKDGKGKTTFFGKKKN